MKRNCVYSRKYNKEMTFMGCPKKVYLFYHQSRLNAFVQYMCQVDTFFLDYRVYVMKNWRWFIATRAWIKAHDFFLSKLLIWLHLAAQGWTICFKKSRLELLVFSSNNKLIMILIIFVIVLTQVTYIITRRNSFVLAGVIFQS